jgi:hypothetical protein
MSKSTLPCHTTNRVESFDSCQSWPYMSAGSILSLFLYSTSHSGLYVFVLKFAFFIIFFFFFSNSRFFYPPLMSRLATAHAQAAPHYHQGFPHFPATLPATTTLNSPSSNHACPGRPPLPPTSRSDSLVGFPHPPVTAHPPSTSVGRTSQK